MRNSGFIRGMGIEIAGGTGDVHKFISLGKL